MKNYKAKFVSSYAKSDGKGGRRNIFVYELPKEAIADLEAVDAVFKIAENGNPIIFSADRFYGKQTTYTINNDTGRSYFDTSAAAMNEGILNTVGDPMLKQALATEIAKSLLNGSIASAPTSTETPQETPVEDEANPFEGKQ